MPTAAATTPDATKRSSLVRLTRMPAWKAASWLSPIAYRDRPNGVIRSITPVITAHTRKMATDHDNHGMPRKPLTPRVLNGAGKFDTVEAPRITLARPRY